MIFSIRNLTRALLTTEQLHRAADVARSLPKDREKAKALYDVSNAYAKRHDWRETEVLAREIAIQEEHVRALSHLAAQLKHAREEDKAEALWQEASTIEFALLAIALACAGQIPQAEKIDSEIPKRSMNIRRTIALSQMASGQATEAIATACSLAQEEQQSSTLNDLVTMSCQAQQWERAQEIVSQIQTRDWQTKAKRSIALGLVRAGKPTEAEKIARSIENEFYKANVLCDLATALAQAHTSRRAEKLAFEIKNPRIQKKAFSSILFTSLLGLSEAEKEARSIEAGEEREDALCKVASAYVGERRWVDAERIAGVINDKHKRDDVWATIATERAREEQWPQAISAFGMIQQSKQRIEVLHPWGTFLIEQGNEEISEQLEHRSRNSWKRVSPQNQAPERCTWGNARKLGAGHSRYAPRLDA